MNLVVDIGNTRTKIALFEEERMQQYEVWPSFTIEQFREWPYNHLVEKVILSVVGKMEAGVVSWLSERFFCLELTEQTPIPIQNRYETPNTLGRDRLAAVVGAFELFPGHTCLVIDAGTCITYDLLTAEGVFLGGNIAPGIDMRLRAMHQFTASLPLVSKGDLGVWYGVSTETALRNGGQLGALLEAEAFIQRCEQQWSDLYVVATGGDAGLFGSFLKREIFVNPHLVLIGLNKILNYNA